VLYTEAAGGPARVEVNVSRVPTFLEITVDDNGPGIAPERREEAMRAFSRLDSARRPDTAGVGLGLTIARDIARSHGGDLYLLESPAGGLRAMIRLPV
jgi:two-component system osmolarity sensor histidine kinase EnvZ